MNKKKSDKVIITFHNPNTPEDSAKFLIKIIADNISENIINEKILSVIDKIK